jgi:hypothetical protein
MLKLLLMLLYMLLLLMVLHEKLLLLLQIKLLLVMSFVHSHLHVRRGWRLSVASNFASQRHFAFWISWQASTSDCCSTVVVKASEIRISRWIDFEVVSWG